MNVNLSRLSVYMTLPAGGGPDAGGQNTDSIENRNADPSDPSGGQQPARVDRDHPCGPHDADAQHGHHLSPSRGPRDCPTHHERHDMACDVVDCSPEGDCAHAFVHVRVRDDGLR